MFLWEKSFIVLEVSTAKTINLGFSFNIHLNSVERRAWAFLT